MAITKITYSNKVDLNENTSIANINKVTASDMNEIKTVANNNATNIGNMDNLVGGTDLVSAIANISETLLANINNVTEITFTNSTATLASGAWRDGTNTITTSSLDGGVYLVVSNFVSQFTTGTGNMLGRCVIDGAEQRYLTLYGSSGYSIGFSIVNVIKLSEGTHTLKIQCLGQQSFKMPSSDMAKIYLIKLRG